MDYDRNEKGNLLYKQFECNLWIFQASLKNVGDKWKHEKIEASGDIVKQFTKGKMTLVSSLFTQIVLFQVDSNFVFL